MQEEFSEIFLLIEERKLQTKRARLEDQGIRMQRGVSTMKGGTASKEILFLPEDNLFLSSGQMLKWK